jgi:hypothetical protein
MMLKHSEDRISIVRREFGYAKMEAALKVTEKVMVIRPARRRSCHPE